MTIARGLTLLLAIPLLALLGLGIFLTNQFARIEAQSQFVADLQVESVATLASIARCSGEARVSIRTYLLARDSTEQVHAVSRLHDNQAELNRLLARYGDALISNEKDRRLFTEYRDVTREWLAGAEGLISLAATGRREEAAVIVCDLLFR
jgi:CHASE3 domain sensor protein